MQLEETISQRISQAFEALFGHNIAASQISLQPTRKEFAGSFTFVTFPYAKQAGKKPEELGEVLGSYLKENAEEIKDYNVVKGFLNLEVQEKVWLRLFRKLMEDRENGTVAPSGKHVMVEYSSPNTNKPLHLGHLRNNFLGYSVSEILKANGHRVFKANLVNDRGIHICKSMLAYRHFGNGETPESSGVKGDHLAGKYYVLFDKAYKQQVEELVESGVEKEEAKKQAPLILEAQEMLQKWEQGDEETVSLWKRMNSWVYAGFEETYRNIGVDFDKFYYESGTYMLGKERVEEGLQKHVFYRKPDGSVWVDLTEEGLDQKLVLRSDGTSVYITQDLGTAELKYSDFPYDQSVYVVADEQNYHFQVLKAILKKLEKPYAAGIYHLSYGMVDLPSGKMKSREGTVVDADELVGEMIEAARQQTEELGKIEGFSPEEAKQLYHTLAMGALKYFLLKVDPKKRMLFNPQESIDFKGNTGPFIQYTHARISAILRKAAELGISADAGGFDGFESMHEAEQEVIVQLVNFRGVVKEAGALYAPSVVANYAYELAKAYNRFYQEISIFNETNEEARRFRIGLSFMVARYIRKSMSLLGIAVPERM